MGAGDHLLDERMRHPAAPPRTGAPPKVSMNAEEDKREVLQEDKGPAPLRRSLSRRTRMRRTSRTRTRTWTWRPSSSSKRF